MEGKLIKQEKEYYALYTNKGIFISDVNGGSVTNRLSLKNCQEIENGYDLDKLALDYYKLVFGNTKSYKDGFQKALELLGDKKFSEEDISKAINFGVHVEAGNIDIDYKRYGTTENQFIQSLQKTEWDVTFNPEEKDSEGCLILKRL